MPVCKNVRALGLVGDPLERACKNEKVVLILFLHSCCINARCKSKHETHTTIVNSYGVQHQQRFCLQSEVLGEVSFWRGAGRGEVSAKFG